MSNETFKKFLEETQTVANAAVGKIQEQQVELADFEKLHRDCHALRMKEKERAEQAESARVC